jgi:L-aspartate oxidase
VWLDATVLEDFAVRFPTIAADLETAGLDPARDWLPVAPAAHYHCGGVITDLQGATAMPGLWAAGEVTCTGVHGANRLASNSLLEGMVFGPRAVEAIAKGVDGPQSSGAMRAVLGGDATPGAITGRPLLLPSLPAPAAPTGAAIGPAQARDTIQLEMTHGAGVLRSADSLDQTLNALAAVAGSMGPPTDAARHEVRNLVSIGHAVLVAATAREESRGAHTRQDHPEPSGDFRVRLVVVPGES